MVTAAAKQRIINTEKAKIEDFINKSLRKLEKRHGLDNMLALLKDNHEIKIRIVVKIQQHTEEIKP